MKGGKLDDPAWRRARAVKAGRAAAAVHARRARKNAAIYRTPEAAYAAGYRTGYRRAYVAWKRWALAQKVTR